jgi:hypothetical protein
LYSKLVLDAGLKDFLYTNMNQTQIWDTNQYAFKVSNSTTPIFLQVSIAFIKPIMSAKYRFKKVLCRNIAVAST